MAVARAMIAILMRLFLHRVVQAPAMPLRVVLLLVAMLAYGSTGFVYFELPQNPDLTLSDGLWYTIVTMATVGYGDLYPKTPAGRFLVGVPLMVFGVGLLAYVLSTLAMALVSAKSKEAKGMASIDLSGHLLVINYPGEASFLRVLGELEAGGMMARVTGVVLLDDTLEELPPRLADHGVRYVRGDATRDETLARAAIGKAAHALVLSRDAGDKASDHLNLSIAIAVIAANHDINTVVECVDPAFEELLRKAGCDRVVCAARYQGYLVAQELMNPGVQDVVQDLVSMGGQQVYLVPYGGSASTDFAQVAEAARRQGHLALGLRRGQAINLNPGNTAAVTPGDFIVTMGAGQITGLG